MLECSQNPQPGTLIEYLQEKKNVSGWLGWLVRSEPLGWTVANSRKAKDRAAIVEAEEEVGPGSTTPEPKTLVQTQPNSPN